MSAVVGGFLVPHVPTLLAPPDPANEVRAAVDDAFAAVAARLARLEPTTAIVIGADHYVMFGPDCLPQILIANGEIEGPLERVPNVPRSALPTNQALAEHIRVATSNSFDWAVSRALTLDHSTVLPYHRLVRPYGDIGMIPIYLASGVEPLLPMPRAVALGRAIGAAVAAHDGDERVVVIGSGGISHSVGTARMGEINEDFDRRVLDLVVAGDVDTLAAVPDDEVLAEGGNGALELRQLLCAHAAVGGTADLVAYIPAVSLITGMGFVELLAPSMVPT